MMRKKKSYQDLMVKILEKIYIIKLFSGNGNIKDINDFLKKINSFENKYNIIIQAFDANYIYGKNHIRSSVEHAIRSMEQKTNTTNSLGMEVLLYASGERQLKRAIPRMGIKRGRNNIVLVFLFKSNDLSVKNGEKMDQMIDEIVELLSLKRDDKVIDGDLDVLRRFGFNDKEIKTVPESKYGDLILEKIAMVDVIK